MQKLLIGLTFLLSISAFAADQINLTAGGSATLSGFTVNCKKLDKEIFEASGSSLYRGGCDDYLGRGHDTNSRIVGSLLQGRKEALNKAKKQCQTAGYGECYIVSNEIESRRYEDGRVRCGAFATVIGLK